MFSLDTIQKLENLNTNRVLRLCIATWQGELGSFSSNMFNGIAKVVVTYGNKLKDEVFKERLGEMPIKQLTRQAKDRCPGCMGFAEVMVMTYNGKKKTPGNLNSVNCDSVYA